MCYLRWKKLEEENLIGFHDVDVFSLFKTTISRTCIWPLRRGYKEAFLHFFPCRLLENSQVSSLPPRLLFSHTISRVWCARLSHLSLNSFCMTLTRVSPHRNENGLGGGEKVKKFKFYYKASALNLKLSRFLCSALSAAKKNDEGWWST